MKTAMTRLFSCASGQLLTVESTYTDTTQIKNKKIISIREADTIILTPEFWRRTLGCRMTLLVMYNILSTT